MLWTVDPTDPTPLFTQLVNSVRRAIATGELSVGDRLPAARELARSLDINMHTVLRAYQDLREAGLVELRRGRGAVVRRQLDPEEALAPRLDDLLADASTLGLDRDALISLLTQRPHPGGTP